MAQALQTGAGMVRLTAASLLIVSALTGCASMTRNHERGLVAIGAVTTLFGATTIADGMSCDSRFNVHSTCTHDSAELRDGAIITTAGAALLGFALWKLYTDDRPDEDARPRVVRVPAPAPATTAAPTAPTTSPASPASPPSGAADAAPAAAAP